MLKQYEQYKADFASYENHLIGKFENYAKEYLEQEYDMELSIPININGRLSRVVGRFISQPRNRRAVGIELSKEYIILALITDTFDDIMGTLKHELVHYALFVKGLPHRDSDSYFINECKRQSIPLEHMGVALKHRYACENGHTITRNRKFNENDYLCGDCNGKLHYENQVMIKGNGEIIYVK